MGGTAAESTGMLAAYAGNSGYPARRFVAYPVTGDFAQWCDDLGIPTVEVELSDHFDPELDRNLAGIEAATGDCRQVSVILRIQVSPCLHDFG